MSALRSILRAMTLEATVKRPPAVGANKKRGAPVEHLIDLRCTPLDPIDNETRVRLALGEVYQGLITYSYTADIKPGDVLVQDGRDYQIRAVGDWAGPSFRQPQGVMVIALEASVR